MNSVERRIDNLLNLERCITNAIHEEIEWNLRKGEQTDIKDRIEYILDEKCVQNLDNKSVK